MTGALRIEKDGLGLSITGTASGRILHAEQSLTSSGTLTVRGNALVQGSLSARGTLSGTALTVMNGTSYVLGKLGVGTSNPLINGLSVVNGDIAADYATGTANGYAFQLFTNAVQTILAGSTPRGRRSPGRSPMSPSRAAPSPLPRFPR